MNNVKKIKERCCGCRACEQSCGVKAISFVQNEEGFFYPIVDEHLCVECGACLSSCPIEVPVYNNDGQIGYASYAIDRKVLKNSSSGGIFFSIAKEIVGDDGYVAGCLYNEDNLPFHDLTNDIETVKRMMGSKYVESELGNIYEKIKTFLGKETKVLFTGTPCQVAGLKKFLKKDYDNLFLVDIICHGVPSRLLYKSYLEYEEKRNKGEIVHFNFRSKDKHDWSLTYKIKLKKGNKIKQIENIASLSPYYNSFLEGSIYRESCYICPYSTIKRPGDITIGDFWGIEKIDSSLFNLDGVSAVIINNEKGKRIFERISKGLCYKEICVDDIRKNNGNLNKPSNRPQKREEIYKDLKNFGFDFVVKKHMKKVKITDIIKNKMPNKLRYRIKKILKRI